VRSVVDGISLSQTYDMLSPPVGGPTSVTYVSGVQSFGYDFLFKDSVGAYWMPNTNYSAFPIDNSTLFRDWKFYYGYGVPSACGSNVGPCSLYLAQSRFCDMPQNQELIGACGQPKNGILFTQDKRQILTPDLSVQQIDGQARLVSTQPSGVVTVNISYTATFSLDAPALELGDIDWTCGNEIGNIQYNNKGNAGPAQVQYTHGGGLLSVVRIDFVSGMGLFSFQGGDLRSVCIGTVCKDLVCTPTATISAASWKDNLFNFKKEPVFAAFELVVTVLVGVIIIVVIVWGVRRVRPGFLRWGAAGGGGKRYSNVPTMGNMSKRRN